MQVNKYRIKRLSNLLFSHDVPHFSGARELEHPQEHPAHRFFLLSLLILRIITVTIADKTSPVRIVPILFNKKLNIRSSINRFSFEQPDETA